MTDYYKILELKPGASAGDIKKAYFKLVRKFPPEKAPDKFRQIRDAYEALKEQAENPEESGPSFAPPKDRLARKALEQVKFCMSKEEYSLAADTCEEVLHVFPNEIEFTYQLQICQRKLGKSGKAVKNGERLVALDPENKWYWRELTLSYSDRGYYKKAADAFQKASQMGCNDVEFILDYSTTITKTGDYKKGADMLFSVVRRDMKWNRDNIFQMFDVFAGLIFMELSGNFGRREEILNSILDFIKKYSVYLEENFRAIYHLLDFYLVNFDDRPSLLLKNEIAYTLEKACHQEAYRKMVHSVITDNEMTLLDSDERLGIEFYIFAQYIFDADDFEEMMCRFGILDAKLCLTERREEALREFKILKQEYPNLYENLKDFEALLRDEKRLPGQKILMLNEFEYLSDKYDGAIYYERHPEAQTKNRETVIYDSTNETPYVRETKKIGRNDPCPCGSGRKYKHCCGR
jgi:tetratricopeptide (TPR) repeat protein